MANSLYGSFYGTQFSFDKIYPNRSAMEGDANGNVFINRYVLISYDQGKGFSENLGIDKTYY
jgi:hypothetical protein